MLLPETAPTDAPDRLHPSGPRWRRWARAGAAKGPRFWVRYSPPLFALVFYLVLPRLRRRVQANLRRILGRRVWYVEQRDVLATLANYSHCFTEALALDRPEAQTAILVEDERSPELTQILDQPAAGFILATAHLGAWDAAAGLWALRQGRRITVVMQREVAADAMLLHDQVRRAAGVEIVHVGTDPLSALPLVEHLARGGIVAAQMDRVPEGMRQCAVELHGGPFAVPAGIFKLAAFARVPIIPVFCAREGFFRYSINWGRPIRVASKDRADVQNAADGFAQQLQAVTLRRPTQWFHFAAN